MTWLILITWITRAVLLLLVVLSIWSVSIMIDRYKTFKQEEGPEFWDFVQSAKWDEIAKAHSQLPTLQSRVLVNALSGTREMKEKMAQAVLTQERARLEKGLPVLGSLGSTAPFIGLFGTVLGVIQAFGALSEKGGNIQVVMLAIAEALIATAVGLFVAIPAVLAYNYFARRLRLLIADTESLKDLLISKSES